LSITTGVSREISSYNLKWTSVFFLFDWVVSLAECESGR